MTILKLTRIMAVLSLVLLIAISAIIVLIISQGRELSVLQMFIYVSMPIFMAFGTLTLFVIGHKIKPLNKLADALEEVGHGNLSVNLPTPGSAKDEVGKISLFFAETLSSLKILTDVFEKALDANLHGDVLFQLHDPRLEGAFADIVKTTNAITHEYVIIMDYVKSYLIMVDKDFKVTYANKAVLEATNMADKDVVGICLNNLLHANITSHPALITAAKQATKQLEANVQLQLSPDKLHDLSLSVTSYEVNGSVACILITMEDQTDIKNLQRQTEKLNDYRNKRIGKLMDTIVTAFQEGNLAVDIPQSPFDADTKEIALEQNAAEEIVLKSIGIIKTYVDEIGIHLGNIAKNNFDINVDRDFRGDFGSISASLRMIVESVSRLISEIQSTSVEVEANADKISDSTQKFMLSFGGQITIMDEVTAAANILMDKALKNSDVAKNANQLSSRAQGFAEDGTLHMQEMSEAMQEIMYSSKEIAKVVDGIKDIAFQTNLLALNASVEAARAGEHGRGFSVVAEAVRGLANLSAEAAKEASEMLNKSLSRVDFGAAKTVQIAGSLRSIVEATEVVAVAVTGIVTASEEQATEVGKIRSNIESVHLSVQEDVITVQTNAEVSKELSDRSHVLRGLAEQFKVKK